ncbi:hypothetical protein [Methylopila sp. M107]|nr:hypothetical protein [Methylopila sp. M107]
MQFLDEMMIRLRAWCAERAAFDATAGLDAQTEALVRASGETPKA